MFRYCFCGTISQRRVGQQSRVRKLLQLRGEKAIGVLFEQRAGRVCEETAGVLSVERLAAPCEQTAGILCEQRTGMFSEQTVAAFSEEAIGASVV